jgi:hypothetical protein
MKVPQSKYPALAAYRASNLYRVKVELGEYFPKFLQLIARMQQDTPLDRSSAIIFLSSRFDLNAAAADAICTMVGVPDYNDEGLNVLENGLRAMMVPS